MEEQYPQLLEYYIRRYNRVMHIKSPNEQDGEDLHNTDQLLENVPRERVQIPPDKLTLDSTIRLVVEKR